jgi:hemolysin III
LQGSLKERLITYKTEERLNALTHGLGALLSWVGMYLLLNKNSGKTPFATESIVIYSLSMILLFSASTAYHLLSHPGWKQRLRIADHISIYLLIAGTYTPVALITLVNGNGWLIFYTVWGIALAGTILKLFFTGKYEFLSLILYLLMGWLIVFDIQDLIRLTSTRGLALLAAGGAFYTLGIFFYAIRRIPYNHLIWHFFVLGGAISHWLYIYLEVI